MRYHMYQDEWGWGAEHNGVGGNRRGAGSGKQRGWEDGRAD